MQVNGSNQLCFNSPLAAKKAGWSNFRPVENPEHSFPYQVWAEKKIGSIQLFFQRAFVKALVWVTCGRALTNERIKLWNEQAKLGVVVTKIFLNSLVAQPFIQSIKWGEVIVEFDGKTTTSTDDLILTEKGLQKWDWSLPQKAGHETAINQTAIEYFIGRQIQAGNEKPETVILSLGQERRIFTHFDSTDYLKDTLGIAEVYQLSTPEAVKKHNALVQGGRRVTTLLHLTC